MTPTLLDYISHSRRRALLLVLGSSDHPQAVADLARDVAIREHDTPYESISSEDVKDVYVSLHHLHLPKLEDVNVVTYDQDRKMAALTTRGDRLTADFDRIADVFE